jgi:hypothetical protein
MLDKQSEEIGTAFENGEIDVESFLRQFRELRMHFHTLRAKMEAVETI